MNIASLLLPLLFNQSVELPQTIRGAVGSFILVKPVRLEGKAVRYFSPDSISTFPNELLNDPTCSVVVAAKEGRYRVFAVTAIGDKLSPVAQTIIIIGDSPDPDPLIPPGPQPKPPQPKPPEPSDIKQDPIYQQLVGIVGGLGNEKSALPKLADIYRQAGELSNCADLGALNGAILNIRNQSGIGQQAMTIREALSGTIEKELGTEPSSPLAGGLGDKAKALFKRINLVLLELSRG
jgi:hypothetical protein